MTLYKFYTYTLEHRLAEKSRTFVFSTDIRVGGSCPGKKEDKKSHDHVKFETQLYFLCVYVNICPLGVLYWNVQINSVPWLGDHAGRSNIGTVLTKVLRQWLTFFFFFAMKTKYDDHYLYNTIVCMILTVKADDQARLCRISNWTAFISSSLHCGSIMVAECTYNLSRPQRCTFIGNM